MENECILEEILLKKSQQRRILTIKNYKERLFVLTKTNLTYFNHARGRRKGKKGAIALEKIRCVETVTVNPHTSIQKQHPFQIVHNDGILYVFAKDEESQNNWIEALRNEIKGNSNIVEKYHKGFFADGKFLCCKQSSKIAPGCTESETWLAQHSNETRGTLLPPLSGSRRKSHDRLPPIPDSSKTSLFPPSKIMIALYDYEPSDKSNLCLEEGNKYYVLEEGCPVWWKVRDIEGREGFVPRSYLKETSESNGENEKEGFVPGSYLSETSEDIGVNEREKANTSEHSCQNWGTLEEYDWYVGNIKRAEAEQLLQQKGKEGAFLVRDSNKVGKYTVSVLCKSTEANKTWIPRHYHVCTTDTEKYYLVENLAFDSVSELINYHQHNGAGLATRLRHPVSATSNKAPPPSDLEDGKWELYREDITLLKELGSGQFGLVQLGKWKGQYDVAIKMIKEGSMSEDEFIEEAQVMMKMKHPKLVQLYGVCTKMYPIYIVTEFMANGCLLDYLKAHKKNLTKSRLLVMCRDVCEAMVFLESQLLIHRDVAARNCLVDKDLTVKVADFGMTRYVLDDQYTSSEGTRFPVKWSAPEVFHYCRYSSKSDVWAFGILMWEVFTLGKQPYELWDNSQVVQKVSQGYRLYRPHLASEVVYQIIYSCWHEAAEQRPTFKQLLESFQSVKEDDH
ncbi:cytoplasmic tyrosine-protein kinase BMX [Latimeria chalumnae]|uniref:Tyrosine-protein kinase n=1 Tax=Latimeria chalumnae TaxID=7897 RepID=M3XGL2_LATCH|nr:PREDICTED: cytoplasmic tyrosine-protein kinase BMX [Latimeria chalumnae]|eukprot:XP_014345050.1 PREDICTED: cytoplasmic tyrosine-protein kinase BMX [Latimeria chalumnae]